MSERFHRAVALTIGTEAKVEGLRVSFRVVKSLRREPNPADLTVWNLSADHRAALQERGTTILLEAGYEGDLQGLFLGDLARVEHRHEGPDWVSEVQAGDGLAFDARRISRSFKANTAVKDALWGMLTDLGASAEQAIDALKRGDLDGAKEVVRNGIVAAGPAPAELERIAAGAGLEFSIQDGQVQLLDLGKATRDEAVVLAPSTGLIGSPQPGEKGIVRARSLLNGALRPGGKVQLDSAHVTGLYRVERVEHTGDTHGRDWYSDVEARPLELATGKVISENFDLSVPGGFA